MTVTICTTRKLSDQHDVTRELQTGAGVSYVRLRFRLYASNSEARRSKEELSSKVLLVTCGASAHAHTSQYTCQHHGMGNIARKSRFG